MQVFHFGSVSAVESANGLFVYVRVNRIMTNRFFPTRTFDPIAERMVSKRTEYIQASIDCLPMILKRCKIDYEK